MTTITPYIDPYDYPTGPTSFKTERNTRELFCGRCAQLAYANEETFRFVREAIEAGLENPFRVSRRSPWAFRTDGGRPQSLF